MANAQVWESRVWRHNACSPLIGLQLPEFSAQVVNRPGVKHIFVSGARLGRGGLQNSRSKKAERARRFLAKVGVARHNNIEFRLGY